MRSNRRFRPAIDCLQDRIAPSVVASVSAFSTGTSGGEPVMLGAMDDTGSPGTDPSGYGSYPIILAPPPGTSPTGTVC